MSLILSGTDGLSDVDGSAATPAIRGTDANTGIFFPAADTIAFSEGGAEAMRIDSSANVGIATSSPRVRLDVRSDAVIAAPTPLANAVASGVVAIGDTVGSVIGLQLNGSSYDTYFQARNMGAGSTAYNLLLQPLGGNVGIGTASPAYPLTLGNNKRFGSLNTAGAAVNFSILDGSNNLTFGDDSANTGSLTIQSRAETKFVLNGAERMRVSAAGELLVGTTSVYSAPKMAVAFTSAVNNGLVFYQTNNSTGTFINFFSNSTTQQGSIINNNNGTVNYANASDYRLKENIVDFDENGLNLISNVKVRKFNRKEYPDATITGFIAHELAEVCPQAVCGEKDAVNEDGSIKAQSVDQSYLVPFLVKAIQEQQALITALTARITALENK